jgi:hypothetical protein
MRLRSGNQMRLKLPSRTPPSGGPNCTELQAVTTDASSLVSFLDFPVKPAQT